MELRDYIEEAIKRKGSVKALAEYLCIKSNNVTNAKAHQRGLPSIACVKLSELLNVDLKTVLAASELATERKEAKRAFWRPFVQNTTELSKAASYALILSFVANLLTTNPAEAAPVKEYSPRHFVLCKARKIFYALRVFFVSASNFCKYFVNRSLAAA